MNIFFCSDHHFYHKNIIKFTKPDGTLIRQFSDLDHMHEHFIAQHNSVVKPNDVVYFLGDVVLERKDASKLGILHRLNGRKHLVRGNHDELDTIYYLDYFEDVHSLVAKYGVIMSHVPIHPGSIERWNCNLHGHLHYKRVLDSSGHPDPRYINVSMEQLDNYKPISLDELNKRIPKNHDK